MRIKLQISGKVFDEIDLAGGPKLAPACRVDQLIEGIGEVSLYCVRLGQTDRYLVMGMEYANLTEPTKSIYAQLPAFVKVLQNQGEKK